MSEEQQSSEKREAYRLLSASARGPPGTWAYAPDSKSGPAEGIRCNFEHKAYTVLQIKETG